MRKLFIDGKTIQDDGNCYVIAEIGHNHQGDLETAKEMLRVAKECGADAVKLQKRDNSGRRQGGQKGKEMTTKGLRELHGYPFVTGP